MNHSESMARTAHDSLSSLEQMRLMCEARHLEIVMMAVLECRFDH